MIRRSDRWFDLLPIGPLVDTGLTAAAAYSLLREFTGASQNKRRAMLEEAIRSAAADSDVLKAPIEIEDLGTVFLDSNSATAFCRIATDYADASVRRQLAILLGQATWSGGISLLSYLLLDDDAGVTKSATASLRKLDPSLRRVLPLPETIRVKKGGEFELPSSFTPNARIDDVIAGVDDGIVEPPGRGAGKTERDGTGDAESQTGAAPAGLPAATVQRFTHLDYSADAAGPHRGEFALSLKVKREEAAVSAADIRIREGKDAASLVAHATSEEFEVVPEVLHLTVPRNGDSNVARFTVEASHAASGSVTLTIFDETRLVGSLRVWMNAVEKDGRLTLQKLQTEIFRDPAASADIPRLGITIQVSVARGTEGLINFHTPALDANGTTHLMSLGTSPQALLASGLQASLVEFRKQIQILADQFAKPGAPTRSDALKALDIRLTGLGHKIYTDALSEGVRRVLENRAPDTVIHWVIKDDALDAIPWEFAFQKHQTPTFVRVPVWVRIADQNVARIPPDSQGTRKAVYVLGDGVVTVPEGQPWSPERVKQLMKVLGRAGASKFELKPNFSEAGLKPLLSLTTLCPFIEDAGVVHIFCHGAGSEADLYLQLSASELGRIRPTDVNAWQLRRQPVVFVNACSSGAAEFSAAGFTTFGKSFLQAGASIYIGTLAPVVTDSALTFATAFFDAWLGDGLSIPDAMNRVRKSMAEAADPNWRLYSIYGDVQAIQSLTQ